VKYELGFYIPEDDILHSHRREHLKSYIALTGWTLYVSPVKYELCFISQKSALSLVTAVETSNLTYTARTAACIAVAEVPQVCCMLALTLGAKRLVPTAVSSKLGCLRFLVVPTTLSYLLFSFFLQTFLFIIFSFAKVPV
jgi:hypothetical protein